MPTPPLTLNGEPWPVTSEAAASPATVPDTLADLLAALGVPPDAVATAVNGQFVPRDRRADHRLHAGDSVTTFQPIVGG
ncbi:sulfur carrier protein ThiS [Hydrogenophaga soli]